MTFNENALASTQFHPSWFEGYRFVYPVVSRRANGVSLGVNLSPTKLCNFRCVYCQVERGEKRDEIARAVATTAPERAASLDVLRGTPGADCRADLDVLETELSRLATATLDGSLFRVQRFADVEASRRVLRDFAFSGDGEPTLAPQFPDAVSRLINVRKKINKDDLKLILITNATRLTRPEIVETLDRFDAANGEIWAKLDAGDPERFRTVDRAAIPFDAILKNLEFAASRWRVKIQTALFLLRGQAPTADEFARYCERIGEILAKGGRLESVQLYTIARVPAEPDAEPLADDAMDDYAATLRRETGAPVEVFYSR